MAKPFWSLENYWDTFGWEMRKTEPLARNDPDVMALMYFAFHAGAEHVVQAIYMREKFEPGMILGKVLEDFCREHLAAMEHLSPVFKEAALRLPNSRQGLVDLIDHFDFYDEFE